MNHDIRRWLDQEGRRALTGLLIVLAGSAVLWTVAHLLGLVLRPLVLFGAAAVVALALEPLAERLTRPLHHRAAAVATTYALAAVVAAAAVCLLVRPSAEQAAQLAGDAPGRLQAVEPQLESVLGILGIAAEYETLQARLWAGALDAGHEGVGQLLRASSDAGGLLADIGLVVVVSFYMLLDGPRIGRQVLAYVPGKHHETARRAEHSMRRVLGGYLRGQVLLAGIVGVLAGIGCWLLGVPYALMLGLLAGLLELVPMVGSVLSAVPAIAVAVWQPFPTVLWVLLLFVVIQQVESNVLAPRVTGHAVGLHPLAALFAVLVGFELGGVLGSIVATPIVGIVWELLRSAGPLATPEGVAEATRPERAVAVASGLAASRS